MRINSFYKTAMLLIVACNATFAQITYQNEDYSLNFGPNMDAKTSEDFRFISSDNIYTCTTFNSLTKTFFFGTYNRSDFSLVSRVENKGKWKKDGIDLEADTLVNNADGSFRFIAIGYDKKKDLLKFYSINFTKEGTETDINFLVDVGLKDEKYASINYIKTEKNFVITVLADHKSDRNMQIHAVLFDEFFEIEEHVSGKLTPKSNHFVSAAFNEKKNSLVVCVRSSEKAIGSIPFPSTKQLYGLNFSEQKIINTALDFDEFDLSSANLVVNPNTNDVVLVGLAGKKQSNKIGATAFVRINSEDFSIGQVKLVGIAEECVQELTKAKTGYDKIVTGSKSVAFKFKNVFFLKDGSLYTVFEDRYGQYILLTDAEYKMKWQTFNAVSRFGRSKITLNENSLEIICPAWADWMEKAYPGNEMLADSRYVYDRCVVKFSVSPSQTKLDILFTCSVKELKYYSLSIEEIAGQEDQSSTFINAMHGSVLNGKKRAFIEIK